jgi:hypothetical protein
MWEENIKWIDKESMKFLSRQDVMVSFMKTVMNFNEKFLY